MDDQSVDNKIDGVALSDIANEAELDKAVDGVELDEQSDAFESKLKIPTLNKLVVKLGLAKDYEKSNLVLIIIAVVAIALAAVIYAYFVADYNPFAKKIDQSKMVNPLRQIIQQRKNGNI